MACLPRSSFTNSLLPHRLHPLTQISTRTISISASMSSQSQSHSRALLIDIHTHIYTPSYLKLLRNRTEPPRILPAIGSPGTSFEEEEGLQGRLIILPGGDDGRPIGAAYWDKTEKIKFMDRHGIDGACVSLANPWLDFLEVDQAVSVAQRLNRELEAYCMAPNGPGARSPDLEPLLLAEEDRLRAFGVLPLVPLQVGQDQQAALKGVLEAVELISNLPHLCGIIIGTRGFGLGLDDSRLDPLWKALERTELLVFIHPHYGITAARGPESAFGPLNNGHVLPLALGFPFETTIAISRLILAGVLDRFPTLRLLLAHAAGALPLLSARLSSCIDHDPLLASRLSHPLSVYLRKLYYDAVVYGPQELALLNSLADPERVMFGTDHPFFPPLARASVAKWDSVTRNLEAVDMAPGLEKEQRDAIKGINAARLCGFKVRS
ncbi:hypothetical protein CROQUDRAFT_651995 [Cronartium quercuum f. sp. fusiforme G11]|uniref:Amidohydrolase-related domain-containing protein n=1 Tax=Cronartium quercuum f. sp. fusiforme G11 TaxID=708437 RepID=A0A9P6TGH9_9BASI|nr:hypothetical protein CROQUDRAFT_651995 [Cronartium quercuum f. sp. fusiforme G11]